MKLASLFIAVAITAAAAAAQAQEYTYRIKAQFEPSSGVGQRLTGRICEFTFAR